MNEFEENRVEPTEPEQAAAAPDYEETVYPEEPPAEGASSAWVEARDEMQQPNQPVYGWQQPPRAQPWGAPPPPPPYYQNAPQPAPWQRQAPPPYGAHPYPQQPYYPPQKKKFSTGTKVFIWVASILAGLAIFGFAGYVAFIAVHGIASNTVTETEDHNWSYVVPLPDEEPEEPDDDYDDDYDYDDDEPDFDEDVETPDTDEPLPEIDVTPNEDGIQINEQPDTDELSVKEVYQRVVKSTVTVAVSIEQNGVTNTGTGTGIIATSDGYIITNSHVVMNSKSSRVKITTYDGEEYDAVVVGVDRTTDLAVLKTNDYNFTPAEFGNTDEMEIGDEVIAIGNPGGAKFSGSLTVGYVSGLDRAVGKYSESGMTYLQTDAAINPGNSGGPLVNHYGQVIAINSSKIVSDGYEGMAFAIPVSKAQPILNELLSGGYVKGRVRLGITGQNITDSNFYGYSITTGFMIIQIDEDSAFQGTDAQPGDIITAVDGEEIANLDEMSNLLLKYSPGDEVTITLNRNGKTFDVTITLLEDKGETQK